MADEQDSSVQWQKANVIEQLRRQAQPDQLPTAQVFLEEAVDMGSASMEQFARQMLKDANVRSKTSTRGQQIGKLRPLAKSFSVTANLDVLAEIAKSPSVKSILPSKIDDIYPKPYETD